jgi:hypothetical protein
MIVSLRVLVVAVTLLLSSIASARPIMLLCPSSEPQIDGAFSSGEWASAQTLDIQVNLPEGGTTPGRLYLMNDGTNLYVALRITRAEADPATTFSVNLDTDYDRQVSPGDDTLGVTYDLYGGTTSFDNVYYTGGECPEDAICSSSDTTRGGTNDVTAAVGAAGGYVIYEMSKPLLPTDGLDATMVQTSGIAMTFAIRLLAAGAEWPNGIADTYYPSVPSAGLYVDYTIRMCP